jgi:hypothetical protein
MEDRGWRIEGGGWKVEDGPLASLAGWGSWVVNRGVGALPVGNRHCRILRHLRSGGTTRGRRSCPCGRRRPLYRGGEAKRRVRSPSTWSGPESLPQKREVKGPPKGAQSRGEGWKGLSTDGRCLSTHPVPSSSGRGLGARPSRLGEASSSFTEHTACPCVSPVERGGQGPTGGKSSRGEGEKGLSTDGRCLSTHPVPPSSGRGLKARPYRPRRAPRHRTKPGAEQSLVPNKAWHPSPRSRGGNADHYDAFFGGALASSPQSSFRRASRRQPSR